MHHGFLRRAVRVGALAAWGLTLGQPAEPRHGTLHYFRSDGGVAVAPGRLPDRLDAPDARRWRVPMDPGHSTPILHAGRLYLTTFRAASKELATVAVEAATGRVLWRRAIVPERLESLHRLGSPATATAACDGQRVFVFFGSYGLRCHDLEGHALWERRFGPFQDEFGAGSSPILIDDMVILNQDHDTDSFLIALDGATGKTRWRTARPDAVRSYSTPVVWTHAGARELLVAGGLELAAYDPASGEKRWWTHGLARIVIPLPVVSGDTIYMASWTPGGDVTKRLTLDAWPAALGRWDRDQDGRLARAEIDDPEVLDRFFRMDLDQDGRLDRPEWDRHAAVFQRAQNAVLALRPTGRGDLTEQALVWKHLRGSPYVPTPLVDHGRLWVVRDGGLVTKFEAASGKVLQEERLAGIGNYFASPVAGDDRVFFASELGVLTILANAAEWRVTGSHDFREKIYATPLLHEGCVFVRTERALYCFQDRRD